MSVKRVASRYAKSLLDLARERGQMDVVLNDVNGFKNALQSRDLVMMLKSPIVNAGKKKEVIKTLFEGKLSDITFGFINIALTKGRESLLPEIAEEFIEQHKFINQISSAILTVAAPLAEGQLEEIKKKIAESNITLDNVEVTVKVDPSIIGGFVIEIGDQLYDASVKHNLNNLKKELTGSAR